MNIKRSGFHPAAQFDLLRFRQVIDGGRALHVFDGRVAVEGLQTEEIQRVRVFQSVDLQPGCVQRDVAACLVEVVPVSRAGKVARLSNRVGQPVGQL